MGPESRAHHHHVLAHVCMTHGPQRSRAHLSGSTAKHANGGTIVERKGRRNSPRNRETNPKPSSLGRISVGSANHAPHGSQSGGRDRWFGLPNADRSYRLCGAGLASDRAVPYLCCSPSPSLSPSLSLARLLASLLRVSEATSGGGLC